MVVRVADIGDDTLGSTPANGRVNRNYNQSGGGNDVALGVSDSAQAAAGSTGTANFGIGNDAWVAATVALRPYTDTLCANPPASGSTTLAGGVVNTYYPGTATANARAVSTGSGRPAGRRPPLPPGTCCG